MNSYSKSCQCNFCRPEISVCTTHFLHHSCYTLFTYRRHMLFVSCLFLVVIRMQNTRVLKDQKFNSLTGQEIPCMLLNQSVFHFRCHSSSPATPALVLSQFNPIHVPQSYLRCILIFLSPLRLVPPCVLTYFRFATTKRCVHFHTYRIPAHFIPLHFIDHSNNDW